MIPEDCYVYTWRAEMKEKLGDIEGADIDYKKAAELNVLGNYKRSIANE